MTDKEYQEYFDRLMGVEGIEGLDLFGDMYDKFILCVAKSCISLRNLCGKKKKKVEKKSSRYIEIPVNERFVPWSMQSSVCEDPGQLDEPENS